MHGYPSVTVEKPPPRGGKIRSESVAPTPRGLQSATGRGGARRQRAATQRCGAWATALHRRETNAPERRERRHRHRTRTPRSDCGERHRSERHVLPCKTLRERSEEHTSELQSRLHLVCRLLLEKKKKKRTESILCID